MKARDAERLKGTLVAIFRRRGENGRYTQLFDELDALQRNKILAIIKLHQAELPIIGSVLDSGNWLVLTTERLVWSVGSQRREVPADAVRDATADFEELQHSSGKLEMGKLQVVTVSGAAYPIELEPGAPLSGTWSVLKNLGARNRSLIATAR